MPQLRSLWIALLGLAGTLCLGAPASAGYIQLNLVSDGTVPGTITDPHLVNPWGLASGPTTPFWAADNGTGLSTLYNGNTGQPQPLVVTIPPPAGSPPGTHSTPTGVVFNPTSGFQLTPNPGSQ